MAVTFKLPGYFKSERMFDLVKSDDFSYVEYRQYQEQGNNELLLTSSMLVVVLNGTKIIHTDGKRFEIGRGRAFFARKGSYVVTERLSPETGSFESLIFFFEDRFLHDFIEKYLGPHQVADASTMPGIFPLTMSSLVISSIEGVLPYFTRKGDRTRSILRLKFQEILLNLLDSEDHSGFHAFLHHLKKHRKKDLCHVVEKNLVKNLTINELARLSGRSLTGFKREFHDCYGEPPRVWINRKRMERAHALLQTDHRSVTDVCYETGFTSLSHFIKLFKHTYGVTPKQFQKDHLNQELVRMR